MSQLTLRCNYHDAHVEDMHLGPRREISIKIALDPVWNGNERLMSTIHISAIGNYNEIVDALSEIIKTRSELSPNVFLADILDINSPMVDRLVMHLDGFDPIIFEECKITEVVRPA